MLNYSYLCIYSVSTCYRALKELIKQGNEQKELKSPMHKIGRSKSYLWWKIIYDDAFSRTHAFSHPARTAHAVPWRYRRSAFTHHRVALYDASLSNRHQPEQPSISSNLPLTPLLYSPLCRVTHGHLYVYRLESRRLEPFLFVVGGGGFLA